LPFKVEKKLKYVKETSTGQAVAGTFATTETKNNAKAASHVITIVHTRSMK